MTFKVDLPKTHFSQPAPLLFEPTKIRQGDTIIEYSKITKMRVWSSSLREFGTSLVYLTIVTANGQIVERFSLGSTEGNQCSERFMAAVRYFIMPIIVDAFMQKLRSSPKGVKLGIYNLTTKGIETGLWVFRNTLPWSEYAGCRLNRSFHPVGSDLTEMRPAMLRIFDIGMYRNVANGRQLRWKNLTARTDFALFLPDLLDACYALYVLRVDKPVQPDFWIDQFQT